MAMTNYKGRLMFWDAAASGSGTAKWQMVCPTKGNPALGGSPENIDASTNEDAIQVNIPGRQTLDQMAWTFNYSKEDFVHLKHKLDDKKEHHFAQWFGPDGDGADGIFEFDGIVSLAVSEADSYGLVEATITIGNTTPIYGPQKVATDFTASGTKLVENLAEDAEG